MKPVILKAIVTIFIGMLIGCTHPHTPADLKPSPIKPIIPEAPSSPAPKNEFHVHKVRWPEETLSSISQWYTGSYKNWKVIARANPGLHPRLIQSGSEILIPADLLETNEPMPREYLRTSSRKKESAPSPRVKPAIEFDETKLFEPQYKKQPATGLEEIELFEPRNEEQLAAGSEEIELFGPQDTETHETGPEGIDLFEPR